MTGNRPVLLLVALLAMLIMAGCDEADTTDNGDTMIDNIMAGLGEQECPAQEWPMAEPDYTSKVTRDFTAFDDGLARFTPERAAELDAVLTTATIPKIQGLLESGNLTSEELVTYYVDRIKRYDVDKLNSVMTLNQQAPATAAALDAERAENGSRGPLHGIPVLLKDNIATADMLTTAGAYALRNWQPERDAFLVSQLRDAGAIILGKTNLSEFANYTDPCTPNGFSTLGGQTQNVQGPFDPLGSSSGSAVAAAANFAAATVGTETQGSLIAPADVNGVFTLKTSRGLVSRDHIVPLLEAQDVPGPMARNATDLAVMLTAMAGSDTNDPVTAELASLDGTNYLTFASPEAAAGLRVGVPTFLPESADTQAALFESLGLEYTDEARQQFIDSFAEQNRTTSDPMAAALEQAGLQVVRVDAVAAGNIPGGDLNAVLPYGFRTDFDAFMQTLGANAPIGSLAEVAALNAEDPANRVPYGQRYITGAVESEMTAAEFEEAVATNRSSARDALEAVLKDNEIDVLFFQSGQAYAPAGLPALSVPTGLNEDGEADSIHLIAAYGGEGALITAAYALEQAGAERPIPTLGE